MILFGSSDFLQTSHAILGGPKNCYCAVFVNSFSACMAAAFFYGFFVMKLVCLGFFCNNIVFKQKDCFM